MTEKWHDAGPIDRLSAQPVSALNLSGTALAVIQKDGVFSVMSGVCNHAGGPLGSGRLQGEYLECPWHYWKFHWRTGQGEPGFEGDALPVYTSKVENGHLWVDLASKTPRHRQPHVPHPLARAPRREPGAVRVVGISTTAMTADHPRFSTSDFLLDIAMATAREAGCETQLIRLRDLHFRACEGFYSKSAHACTWPCSITQMDPTDQLDQVYEAIVHWADVMIVATPIRWGNAGSLYYKLVERMNCIQNQQTIAHRELLKNKVASFIITGGQDNIQAVAGQMLGFFGEIGCVFPQFPYVAHSRGWSAEDMEHNVVTVRSSAPLREATVALSIRSIDTSRALLAIEPHEGSHVAGGRKAHPV